MQMVRECEAQTRQQQKQTSTENYLPALAIFLGTLLKQP